MVTMMLWQVQKARRLAWDGLNAREIAKQMRLAYGPVYNAIIGHTWYSVQSPPPLPVGTLKERKKRPIRTCSNCGKQYQRGGTTKRCGACSTYFHRHGVERLVSGELYKRARISPRSLEQLYKRYLAGESIESLAESQPFSAETLRRRFVAAGYAIRPPTGLRQQLTPGIVSQARELHHNKGVTISSLAARYGVNYQTLHSAVMGYTWRGAGGPVPEREGEKRPCQKCEMLTGNPSGLCRYCQ